MNIRVKQRDLTDCGAACLASVARYYGRRKSVSEIRQNAGTGKNGTNLLGMINAAGKMGFAAKGIRTSFDQLPKIYPPMIAHLAVSETLNHYVVIYKITKAAVRVMDPSDGVLRSISAKEFEKMWTGVLLLLLPENGRDDSSARSSAVSRLFRLARIYKTVLMQALAGAIIYTILGLGMSIFLQKLVDFVIGDSNYSLLHILGIAMVAVVLLQVFVGAAKNFLVLKAGQSIDARLILGFHKHLMSLPQSFFDSMRTGEITSRFGDAVKMRLLVNDLAVAMAVSICTVITASLLMLTYYWKLAAVILLIIPLYCVIYYLTNLANRRVQRSVMENGASLEAILVETLSSIATIKKLNLQEFSNAETARRFNRLLSSLYAAGRNSIFSGSSTEFTSQITTVVVLWAGAFCVLQNQISLGELLSFYALTVYFFGPAASLVNLNKGLQDALIAADRLFEILDLPPEEPEQRGLISLNSIPSGNIVFKDVSFAYGNTEKVFSNLNLTMQLGKITGIAGPSGCGKSTIAALLQHLYTFEGRISIGRHDIRDITRYSLRSLIGVVPQQIDLFDGDIIHNVAPGHPEPDMARLTGLCTVLGISDFVERLPDRYRTNIGQNGLTLSGGQRQRIAFARTLYRRPEILILDEATSLLDPVSEQLVQSAILDFAKQGKTVIIIAHRLSTLMMADKIVVIKDGRLIEEGTHQSLLARRSAYFGLWMAGYPPEGHVIYKDTVQTAETEKPKTSR